ncbi:MAG: hypothetical protein AAGA63_08215 [Pseudomonadota bacterium]
MSDITHVSTTFSSGTDALLGAVQVQAIVLGNDDYFVVAGASGALLDLYKFENDTLQLVDRLDTVAAFGLYILSGVSVLDMSGGGTLAVPTGLGPNHPNFLTITQHGFEILSESETISQTNFKSVAEPIEFSDDVLIVGTGVSGGGLEVLSVATDGALKPFASVDDTDDIALGNVTSVTSAELGGDTFLFAVSSFDAGLSSFEILENGTLSLVDTVLPTDGSGFSLPTVVVTVDVGASQFLVMASAGSGNLTSFKIGAHGDLTEMDQVLDSGTSRFADASVLEGFSYGDRGFVVAAGSDDGFTLFEVGPFGELFHLLDVVDDFGTALQNIADLEVVLNGSVAQITAVSGTDHGISVFEVDVATLSPDAVIACIFLTNFGPLEAAALTDHPMEPQANVAPDMAGSVVPIVDDIDFWYLI